MTPVEIATSIITSYDGPRLRIMEVCGTHTHAIFRLGIRSLLPENITLISGPGCPVCVTPVTYIDEALFLAKHGVTLCTFGDLLRVPGTQGSLASVRSDGANIQIVYTALDAVAYAAEHPDETVTFLSVGFETTTPAACLAVQQAIAQRLTNFTLLTANKTMDAAYLAMADACDAYLDPGHVCAITGARVPRALTKRGISGAIAGFTAAELLTALAAIVKKSQTGKPFLVNAYPRVVTEEGSPAARKLLATYLEPVDAEWRGIGVLKNSGLALQEKYGAYDARLVYKIPPQDGKANPACRCGDILRGACTPPDCPLFGKTCTTEHPIGACMVSREGTCSAWYQYNES